MYMSKLNYSHLKNNKHSIHKYSFFNDEKDKNIDLEDNNLEYFKFKNTTLCK